MTSPGMIRGHIASAMALTRSWIAYAALPAVGIITAPMLARALGPNGRGQLAGILQPMTLAAAVAALGVPSAVTFFIGRKVSPALVIKCAAAISALTTTVVAFGLLFYAKPVAQQVHVNRLFMLIVWLAFLPSSFLAIRRAHIQGLRAYRSLDVERFLGSFLRVLFIAVLWIVGSRNVVLYAASYMAAGLLSAFALRLPKVETMPHAEERAMMPTRQFASYALLASFGTIANAMNARLDQAIMPAVVTATELGLYSVAVAIAEISSIITTVAVRNILAEVSSGVGLRLVVRSLALGGVAQTALIVALLVLLPYLIPVVFGGSFAPALGLVRVLLGAAFVGYWASSASTFLAGLGRPGLASVGPASGAVCTALMFWIMWHSMSAASAAWISVYSQLAALCAPIFILVILGLKRGKAEASTL
jgi:O-antigen/teichoic acid export membrane protein